MMSLILATNLIMLWGVVLLTLLMTLAVVRKSQAMGKPFDVAGIPLGKSAPDFTAQQLNGGTVTKASYLGRAVAFIFIHPKCAPCRDKISQIAKLGPAAGQAGPQLVLVSTGSAGDTQQLIDEFQIRLPVLLSNSDFAKQYNPSGGVPFFCLLDERGMVVSTDRATIGSGRWRQLQQQSGAVPS